MTKISSKELITFSICLASALFVGFGDTILLKLNSNSALFVSIIGTILGFFILYLLLSIFKNSDKDGFFKTNIRRFKYFGHAFNVILLLFAILCFGLNAWTFINFVISQFLTRTSYYFLAIVLFTIVSYAVSKKIEVMGRCMTVLGMIFLLVVIFVWGFLTPEVEIEKLYPFFNKDIPTIIKGILIFISFATTPFFTLFAIEKQQITDIKKTTKNVLIGYTLGALLVTIFIFFLISTYGIEIASLFSYPEYSILKKIHAFNFIERIENVTSVIIFIANFGSLILFLNFICKNINETFKIKNENIKKILIYIVGIIIPIISIYLVKKLYFYKAYITFPWISLGVLILLLTLALLYKLTNKKMIS